jgi:L-amino acid N-acyltransferase YncA
MPPATVIIRPADVVDAPAMLAIYRPYVEGSAVSFEQEVPSVEEYSARVRKYLEAWAGVVAEVDGQVLGYAYGSAHRERAAYKWSVETTVYVAQGVQRSGIGRSLYAALLPALAQAGYCNAYAGIALPNAASVGLHHAAGFNPIGTFPRVGYKFDQWWDVAWFHLVLQDAPARHGAQGADSPN